MLASLAAVDLHLPDDAGANQAHVGSAVRELLGSGTIARLRGEAFRRYLCLGCGGPGRADAEPTTVIVVRYRLGVHKVRFAHARCFGSCVLDVDADRPGAAGLGRMLSKTAVLRYASNPPVRPLLILEPLAEVSLKTPSGESVDLLMSELLARGCTLLRTASQFPAPAAGWLLQASGDAARLIAADGDVLYEGGVDPPESWRDLVLASGACVVLFGVIGLGTHLDAELPVPELRRLLGQAARAGELAGAVVRAHPA